jgi:hypothetical protein
MSITIIKTVQKLDLPAIEKAVAVAFSGHLWESNPDEGAWVGADRLAAETGLAVRTVESALSGLKRKEILVRIGYKTGKRAKMPIYQVHPENGQIHPFFVLLDTATDAGSNEQEPAPHADSKAEEPAANDREPANLRQEPALHALRTRTTCGRESIEKDKRKKEKEPPFSSCTENERASIGQAFFVWLASAYVGLNLTSKEKADIRQTILTTKYSLPVLKQAAVDCLDGLNVGNSWDRASNKLAANLPDRCAAVQIGEKQRQKWESAKQKLIAEGQAQVAKELAEIRAREAAEGMLVEEVLGG